MKVSLKHTGARVNLDLSNFDYPMLFYLQRVLRERNTVLDFGGNIGIHYLRYSRYLNLTKVQWIVWDVPEITKVGRETCAGISNIAFVNNIAEIKEPSINIFLASGSMQYYASPERLLQKFICKGVRPEHILIDQLPLYDGQRFATLQNGGRVYCPQYVFNQEEYVKGITDLAYHLIDTWEDNEHSCVIPFHPEKSIYKYEGLYFSANPMEPCAEVGAA